MNAPSPRSADEPRPEGFWAAAKRLGQGDMGPLVGRLDRQIERAEQHLQKQGHPLTAATRDLAVVSGLALTMLGIRALKVLPSLPFAPGHKLVLLTPLYVVATLKTKGRAGATLTGLTMGVVSFLLGDGKYGVLEIFKHLVPGILCDLLIPPLLRFNPGRLAWSVLGVVLAVGRFGTIFLTTLLVQPPAVAYAFLLPGLAIHCTFGALSGYVSHGLARALGVNPVPLVSQLPPQEKRI